MRRSLAFFTLLLFIALMAPVLGQSFLDRFSAGANFIACRLDNETKGSVGQGLGPGIDVYAKFHFLPSVYLSSGIGYFSSTDNYFMTDRYRVECFPEAWVKLGYSFIPDKIVSPHLELGMMGLRSKRVDIVDATQTIDFGYDLGLTGGGGLQFNVSEQISLLLDGEVNYAVTSSAVAGVPNPDRKPVFWTVKTGVAYSFGKRNEKREEMEYPLGNELALEDLFREEKATASGDDALDRLFAEKEEPSQENTEDDADALDALFSTEEAYGSAEAETPAGTGQTLYTNEEVTALLGTVEQLKNEMEIRSNEIAELKNQVMDNEKIIADLSRQVAGNYMDSQYRSGSFNEFKQKYEAGLQKFYAKNYQDAIDLFQSLLNSDPDHRLASNCQYWIGESYNAMGQYRSAINAFNAVLRYSNSYKFDDALLMNGLCYLKVGDRISAREKFQQLISRFPDSEYAPTAMRYLGRL